MEEIIEGIKVMEDLITKNQTLHLLKPGTGIIKKITKYGFWVDMPYQKNIFIHYSDTLTNAIFDEDKSGNK